VGVIFISHSSKNNAEAVAVRDWLRGEGYAEAFLDLDPEHGLAPGQHWEEELQKAGERCLAVVVLISPDWCASKWCFHEFKFAKALGKKIFPVLIQPTPWSKLPLELTSQFQMANISAPEIREDGLMRLRIGLQRAGLDPKHFNLPAGRPPYRGLKALEEEDAAIFFGRDAQITAGLDALRQMRGGTPQRILTIAAASGAGKSSFLKAGLLARLKRDEENFLVLPTWRPGRDALAGETGLAKSFGGATAPTALDALGASQAAVVQRFASMASAAGETWQGTPPTLVLPLDQAEELFSADNATASGAIQLLLDTLAAKPDLVVVATIRSDALGSLQADSRLAEQLRLFNLPALPPSAFKEVIEGPAVLAKPPIRVEPALTDRLIADLDRADALPLLAFTLERLVADYGSDGLLELREYETGLGGVSGAINAAVEAALRKAEADPTLPSTQHELDSLARAAFIPWLVQLDEADASPRRRVARLMDLPPNTHPLIRHFIDERLLVSQDISGQTIIEVSHEAVLRHWRGLADWIGEERVVLEGLHRIIRSAREWGGNEKTLSAHSPDLLVHRGERLTAAETYLERPDLQSALRGEPEVYLKACRKLEDDFAEASRALAFMESQNTRADELIALRTLAIEKEAKVENDGYGPSGIELLSEADELKQKEAAFLNAVSGLGKRWHPIPAISEYPSSYNDTVVISVFPCCGLQVDLPTTPDQHRPDGCCEVGYLSLEIAARLIPDLQQKLGAITDFEFQHGMRRGTGRWLEKRQADARRDVEYAKQKLREAEEILQRHPYRRLYWALEETFDTVLSTLWWTFVTVATLLAVGAAVVFLPPLINHLLRPIISG
jgi:hypothetical protein